MKSLQIYINESTTNNDFELIPFKNGKKFLVIGGENNPNRILPYRIFTCIRVKGFDNKYHNIGFYVSCGSGGKGDVDPGSWEPFFGIAENDWIVKLNGAELDKEDENGIPHPYGSKKLGEIKQYLSSKFPLEKIKSFYDAVDEYYNKYVKQYNAFNIVSIDKNIYKKICLNFTNKNIGIDKIDRLGFFDIMRQSLNNEYDILIKNNNDGDNARINISKMVTALDGINNLYDNDHFSSKYTKCIKIISTYIINNFDSLFKTSGYSKKYILPVLKSLSSNKFYYESTCNEIFRNSNLLFQAFKLFFRKQNPNLDTFEKIKPNLEKLWDQLHIYYDAYEKHHNDFVHINVDDDMKNDNLSDRKIKNITIILAILHIIFLENHNQRVLELYGSVVHKSGINNAFGFCFIKSLYKELFKYYY